MHLALIGEKLQEELFKTAVKIPVYAADIVSKHILAVIRKFNRLTVRANQVLASKEARKIGAKLKGQRF